MDSHYASLIDQLSNQIDRARLITDPTLLYAYGTDASFYRLTPKLVVQADTLDEVVFVIKRCAELKIPVTFRAAGTSLSGQAISDSVLLMLTRRWRNYEIIDNGLKIRLQPGVIGADANRYLSAFERKIGPDPASINTCKIGGIAANNASGMCCGTAQNSYQTVAGMTVVLADGTVLDTTSAESIAQFQSTHSELWQGLQDLALRCQTNTALVEKIRHKYRLKNTTGYSLNALVDFTDPIHILEHLFIGSEGTLGFIADITYHTVIDHKYKASGLFVFKDIETTCLAVTALSKTNVAAVELMDNRSLHSIHQEAGMPDFIRILFDKGYDDAAALLIEIRAESEKELEEQRQKMETLLTPFAPMNDLRFSTDSQECAQFWAIRKGIFPAVGAVRETGTTAIIEDVSFPVDLLASAVRRLQQMFVEFGYPEAIIYGHALAGNLHFVFTQSFDTPEEIERYRLFMEAITQLVAVEYQGSLKAEHGTGRNMAAYVALEWGNDAYTLMQEIKALFDPMSILNPGVILNDDHDAHLKNLKAMPAADEIIDKCIECGFCEPVCPSRNLSLTPRQRNAVYREISRLRHTQEDLQSLAEMEKAYDYYGLKTCAATGLCADQCPVGINTGELVRKLRQGHTTSEVNKAKWVADHFSTVTKVAKVGLTLANATHSVIGTSAMSGLTKKAFELSGHRVPLWNPSMPRAAKVTVKPTIFSVQKPKVVYFPSCSVRTMGTAKNAKDDRALMDVTISLLEKSGYEVILPTDLDNQCCGMPFKSKGFVDAVQQKSSELENNLWSLSKEGTYPVLMDTSPCACLSHELMGKPIKIYEPFQFVAEFIVPNLKLTPQNAPIMLHITCTSRHKGLTPLIERVARLCANTVIIPEDISCCGFAGDKGFTTPELNASSLALLKQQVPENCTEGYSNSITCEIGLSEHSGIEYRSILYLVDKVSQVRINNE